MPAEDTNYKILGMDDGGGGGGGGFLEIDSDQQIYGDTFGAIPPNPNAGYFLPSSGGNSMLLYVGGGAVVVFLIILLLKR